MLPYDLLYLYDEQYQHQYLLISSKLRSYGPEMCGNGPRSGAEKSERMSERNITSQ